MPPDVTQPVLQRDAERTVVPEAVEPAVDFRGGKDEAATFSEADNFTHLVIIVVVFFVGHIDATLAQNPKKSERFFGVLLYVFTT